MRLDARALILGGFGALIAAFQILQILDNGIEGVGWVFAFLVSAILLYLATQPSASLFGLAFRPSDQIGQLQDIESRRARAWLSATREQADIFLLFAVRNDFHPPKNLPLMGSYKTSQTANAIHFVVGLLSYELRRQKVKQNETTISAYRNLILDHLIELRVKGLGEFSPGPVAEADISSMRDAEENVVKMYAAAGEAAERDGSLQELYKLMTPWFGGKVDFEEAGNRFGVVSSDIIKALRPVISNG